MRIYTRQVAKGYAYGSERRRCLYRWATLPVPMGRATCRAGSRE
ncbi:hypothetical protein [uncultured Parabacteroides sp.]|nr:hypothetical protein [uncultured Parabacteroides sp.]